MVPESVTASLTIRRIAGSSGSTIFAHTGVPIQTVTGTHTVSIVGRDVSDLPRNMVVEARINNELKDHWRFTVFRVEPTAFDSGNVNEVLPPTVMAHAGYGSRPFIDERSLVDLYKVLTNGHIALGHNHVDGYLAYGGIVIRGDIIPVGMDRNDFNTDHSRAHAFNWERLISERDYDENGCLIAYRVSSVKDQQIDEPSDDLGDDGEDLLPNHDVSDNELSIWSMDVPNETSSGTFLLVPKHITPQKMAKGMIKRVRIQFTEQAQYAGI